MLVFGLPALGIVAAFGVAPSTVVSVQDTAIVLEKLAPVAADAPEIADSSFVSTDRVQRGDTVGAILDRLGIRDAEILPFLRSDAKGGTIFRRLVPGKSLQAVTGPEGELRTLRYFVGSGEFLEIAREAQGFAARERSFADAPRVVHKSAVIRSSLFAATDLAGIPDAVAMQIARVFATDIDFHSDLRKGDRLSVAYEMRYESGELVAPGRILAAEFRNGGRVLHAVLFRDEEGKDGHYALDGSNRAKAFLRSPVEFSRVSSGFGARFHPIFRNWRAHTGVDFAAPKGTRVLAAADGVVTGAGWRSGYGNAVEIRHGGSVTTLYGHLSGFAPGVRAGARVHQAQAIGYVGATGFATGPHLHYEFKISGAHQDPMRVALPKAVPVPAHLKPQFEVAATEGKALLALAGSVTAAPFE